MLVSQLTLPSVYNDLPGFRGMRYENISKDFVCMLAHCPLSFIGPFLFQISRSSCRALEFPGDSRQLCLKKFCSMGNPSDSIGHCDIFSDVSSEPYRSKRKSGSFICNRNLGSCRCPHHRTKRYFIHGWRTCI